MANFDTLKETLSRVAEYAREKTDLAVNTGKMAIELNRAKADANAARMLANELLKLSVFKVKPKIVQHYVNAQNTLDAGC